MEDIACIDKAKIPAVITAGMGADEEQLSFRHRTVVGEPRQRPSLAVGGKGLAKRPAVAAEPVFRVHVQPLARPAADPLDHPFPVRAQPLADPGQVAVAEHQVVAGFDACGHRPEQEDTMVQGCAGGHGELPGQPGAQQALLTSGEITEAQWQQGLDRLEQVFREQPSNRTILLKEVVLKNGREPELRIP